MSAALPVQGTRSVRFWIITAAAAGGIVAAVLLGRWQLSRAHEKEALFEAIESRGKLQALVVNEQDTLSLDPQLIHRTATAHGVWIADRTVYLDNRQMDGHVGFYVMTPLRLDSGRVIVVQRGWVPRNFEQRTKLPEIQTDEGPVEVTGRIAPAPPKLFQFGGAETATIRQNLDLPVFAAQTGLPIQQMTLIQTTPTKSASPKAGTDATGLVNVSNAASEGLQRNWPAPNIGTEKNYGYALQWFAIGTLIAILYVWFQLVRPSKSKKPKEVD